MIFFQLFAAIFYCIDSAYADEYGPGVKEHGVKKNKNSTFLVSTRKYLVSTRKYLVSTRKYLVSTRNDLVPTREYAVRRIGGRFIPTIFRR